MTKKILVLLFLQILLLPNFVFAGTPHEIRESTIIIKVNPDAHPSELKELNGLINSGTILESEEVAGLGLQVVKVKNIKGFEKAKMV